MLAGMLAIPALAQNATNLPAGVQPPGQSLSASAAVLTAPMILTNNAVSLDSGDQAEITNGGAAVFTFTITNSGDYVVETLVNAPSDNCNSFFVNMDDAPEGQDMTWDIELTIGFEKRLVSQRGDGSPFTPEFAPMRFALTPGAHKVIIVGREPGAEVKTVTLRPTPPSAP
jgi:hypothetical protein